MNKGSRKHIALCMLPIIVQSSNFIRILFIKKSITPEKNILYEIYKTELSILHLNLNKKYEL